MLYLIEKEFIMTETFTETKSREIKELLEKIINESDKEIVKKHCKEITNHLTAIQDHADMLTQRK